MGSSPKKLLQTRDILLNSISLSCEDGSSHTEANVKNTQICKWLSRLELQQLFKCLIKYSFEALSIIHFSAHSFFSPLPAKKVFLWDQSESQSKPFYLSSTVNVQDLFWCRVRREDCSSVAVTIRWCSALSAIPSGSCRSRFQGIFDVKIILSRWTLKVSVHLSPMANIVLQLSRVNPSIRYYWAIKIPCDCSHVTCK